MRPTSPRGEHELNQEAGVPLIVIAKTPEQSESVNRILRTGGHPVHCTLISSTDDLAEAMGQVNPEMIMLFTDNSGIRIPTVADLRNSWAPGVPILEVRSTLNEDIIAQAMREGAKDTVTLTHTDRLIAVATRELRGFRLERALNQTLGAASQYKEQLHSFLEGSADAIAQISEGIVVGTNAAWMELFGYPEDEPLVGTPVMDLFDNQNHTAIKAALVACMQGKWNDHDLKAQGLLSDNSSLSMVLKLSMADFDGEACVRMCIPARKAEQQEPAQKLERFAKLDMTTSLYNRRHFISHLTKRLTQPARGGVTALLYITVDNFRDIINNIGALGSEDVLISFSNLLRDSVVSGDLYGRFGGTMFVAYINRGTRQDVLAWASNLGNRVRTHVFEAGDKSISATCSIGIAEVENFSESLERLINHADQANETCRKNGGDSTHIFEMDVSQDTQAIEFDKHWVNHVKSALMDNRFHLVHQPIASLTDEVHDMYDVMLRMTDDKGNEVLPSNFIPAAERNGLIKPIDRFVLGEALQFCVTRKASRVFARISAESVIDESLPKWIGEKLKAARLGPGALCIQVDEGVARKHLKQTLALATRLGEVGVYFALEHFGTANDSIRLLKHLRADYAKIDGSLMQGLANNQENQAWVTALVLALKEKDIHSIAERVEDANTMAVLWQCGVQYMQGYYVQEPEVILGTSTL
jgi:diguanylate cyclase (GGDEF)-like protein